MKTKLLPVACCMLLTCYAINSNAQSANRTLSNLISPTAVNQSLLPGTNNTLNLGSGGRGALSWKNLYLGNALYLKGNITLHAPGTNFFVGTNAGNTSVSGVYNTGAGPFSLFKLTSGGYNTANGYQSLYSNTTGFSNTANGKGALFSNTIGDGNTANGYQSLYSNTTGFTNTANGGGALYSNTTGNENTALGSAALSNNTTGNYNTALGKAADVLTVNLFNATAIGSNAVVDASDKVRVGDGSVKSIGGAVEWTKL